MIYVNNNPYCLELYIAVGFDPDHADTERDMQKVERALTAAGARQRSDLTITDFSSAFAQRRFNGFGLTDARSLQLALTSERFASKAQLAAKGIDLGPFGHRPRVFLSHQSDRKPEVLKLRDRLAARDLPTWLDVFDIDYGQNLAEAIEQGIASSAAVILWISPGFLKSNWCRFEMKSFISDYASEDRVQLLAVVDPQVELADVPRTLTRIKYLRLDDGQGAEAVDAEFGEYLKRIWK
ncbi:toll/interleukin-1 receptor domain-containing protein [Blastococcus sp. SYSU DS0510]